MGHIHVCAPLGFLLNCLVAYMYSDVIRNAAAVLVPGDPDAAAALAAATEKFYMVMLALQALGLGLIAMRVRAGIYAAVIGAITMLPFGLVFIVGCLFSHAGGRYSGFPVVPAVTETGRGAFPAAATRPLGISALLLAVVGGGLFLYGLQQVAQVVSSLAGQPPDMAELPNVGNTLQLGLLLLGIAIVQAILYRRCRKTPALTVLDDACIIVPGLFAPRLRIPYADIRLASLSPDASVVALDVELAGGSRRLYWPVKLVAEPMRRQCLETLGTALTDAGVPLE